MNENKQEMIQELQTLIQGCHMGASTFKEYITQTNSMMLERELSHALAIFHKHEFALTERLLQLDMTTKKNEPLSGIIGEFFEKIKAQLASNDSQLLDYALQGVDMSLKSLQQFKLKHAPLDSIVFTALEEMESDYKTIYQKLVDLKLDQ